MNIDLPDQNLTILDWVAANGNLGWPIPRTVKHFSGSHGKETLREHLQNEVFANRDDD